MVISTQLIKSLTRIPINHSEDPSSHLLKLTGSIFSNYITIRNLSNGLLLGSSISPKRFISLAAISGATAATSYLFGTSAQQAITTGAFAMAAGTFAGKMPVFSKFVQDAQALSIASGFIQETRIIRSEDNLSMFNNIRNLTNTLLRQIEDFKNGTIIIFQNSNLEESATLAQTSSYALTGAIVGVIATKLLKESSTYPIIALASGVCLSAAARTVFSKETIQRTTKSIASKELVFLSIGAISAGAYYILKK